MEKMTKMIKDPINARDFFSEIRADAERQLIDEKISAILKEKEQDSWNLNIPRKELLTINISLPREISNDVLKEYVQYGWEYQRYEDGVRLYIP